MSRHTHSRFFGILFAALGLLASVPILANEDERVVEFFIPGDAPIDQRFEEAKQLAERALSSAGVDLLLLGVKTAFPDIQYDKNVTLNARYSQLTTWSREEGGDREKTKEATVKLVYPPDAITGISLEKLDAFLSATLYEVYGDMLIDMQEKRFADALTAYRKSVQAKKELLSADNAAVAPALYKVCSTYYALGEFKAAVQTCEQVLELDERVGGTEYVDTVGVLSDLVLIYAKFDLEKANAAADRALTILRRNNEIESRVFAELVFLKGMVKYAQGEKEAITLVRQAGDISEKIAGKEDSKTIYYRNQLKLVKEKMQL